VSQPKKKRTKPLRRALRLLVLVTLVGVGAYLWWRPSLAQLRADREALRQSFAELAAADPSLRGVPDGDVVIGIPSGYAQGVIEQVATHFLDRVVLHLEGIRFQHQGEVKKKILFGRMKLGTWSLDVEFRRIESVLHAGKPTVELGGGNRVAIAIPVRTDEGQASAQLSFRWDSHRVANLVCRDFEVTQKVDARILPATYDVKGEFLLSADATAVTAKPRFRDQRLRVRVKPSQETWQGIRAALERQDSFWKCGIALKPDDVMDRLRGMLDKGIEIKLPDALFRPIRVPATVRETLGEGDSQLDLSVRPGEFRVTQSLLWYSAAVKAQARREPPTKPPRPSVD